MDAVHPVLQLDLHFGQTDKKCIEYTRILCSSCNTEYVMCMYLVSVSLSLCPARQGGVRSFRLHCRFVLEWVVILIMGDSRALPLELFIRHNAGKAEQDTRRRPYKYLWPSISLALNSKASPTIIHNVATWRAISPSPYFCLSAVQHKVGHRLADVVVCPFIRPSIHLSIHPSILPSIVK